MRALVFPLLAFAGLFSVDGASVRTERGVRRTAALPGVPSAVEESRASSVTADAARARVFAQVAEEGVPCDVREDGVDAARPVVRVYPAGPCDAVRLADLVRAQVSWQDGWELRRIAGNLVVLAPQRVHAAVTALLEPEIDGARAEPEVVRTYDVRALEGPGLALAEIVARECPGARVAARGATLDVRATAEIHAHVERLLASWHRDGPPVPLATLDDITGGLSKDISLVPSRYKPPEEEEAALFSSAGERLAQTRVSLRLEPTPLRDALEPLRRRTGLDFRVCAGLLDLRGDRRIRLDARWARLDHVLDVVAAQISERGDVSWRYDGSAVRFALRWVADFDVEIAGGGPSLTSLDTGPRQAPGPPPDPVAEARQSASGFPKK